MLLVVFNLLLANITVLLCFYFLFLIVFNKIFTSPIDNENARLKLALAIPAGVPITLGNDAMECYHLLQMKQLKFYQIIKRSNIFAKSFTH